MRFNRPFHFNESFQLDEFFYYVSMFSILKGTYYKIKGELLIAEKYLLKAVSITEKFSDSVVFSA